MNKHGKRIAIGAFAVIVSTVASAEITRVSVTSTGGELSYDSSARAISGNGRYVAFQADSPELGITNSKDQAFRYDAETGDIILISEAATGGFPNDLSFPSALSYDGKHAAFSSSASNLVNGLTTTTKNIYVRDIEAGTSMIASIKADGTLANNHSESADISGNGNIVAFDSYASNLVNADTNGKIDIFLKNMTTGELQIISRPDSGESNGNSKTPAISSDGKTVAFISDASNLVSGDTNGVADAFVFHVDTQTMERVSVSSSGTEGNGRTWQIGISANGRYVVFTSDSDNLVANDSEGERDVFVRDLKNNTTIRVSTSQSGQGFAGMSRNPDISADGRIVAFANSSVSNREVPGSGMKIYVKDTETGSVKQIDIGTDNTSYLPSYDPYLSYAGDRIAFLSQTGNLVSGDTNGKFDAFLKDLRYEICE